MSYEEVEIDVARSDEHIDDCEAILRALPEWFGIEEAIVDYVDAMGRLPTWLARVDEEVVGFVSVETHTDSAAEIIVMGVRKEFHRRGIGAALVEAAEVALREQGVEFLQVKTLMSDSHECKNYEKTRRFYEAMGFVPVQEFETLWDRANPCLQLMKSLGQPKRGLLHHVEVYVSDLERSRKFWEWFLAQLDYVVFQAWDEGVSFRRGSTYLVFVQTEEKHLNAGYHRCEIGLNHLAFHASTRREVDEMTCALRERGVTILYEDRHPYAGGPNYYAVFFEDPDRIKVEFVAP